MKFDLEDLRLQCEEYAKELVFLEKNHDIILLNHKYKLSKHTVRINIRLEFVVR